ncbi:MAG: ATP-dependent Clp protease adaptor ClpS [Cyanobacteria bacterium P01_F01_bin.56]
MFRGGETHAIALLNDDVTPMEQVVEALEQVLHMPQKHATSFMLRTHGEGIAIVWTGTKAEADTHLAQMQAANLSSCILPINQA